MVNHVQKLPEDVYGYIQDHFKGHVIVNFNEIETSDKCYYRVDLCVGNEESKYLQLTLTQDGILIQLPEHLYS